MNRVTGGFSHGMGRRLSVVLAAMHEPQVLLLDEPFDGVDPIGVEATFEVIADARARGATILLSTHLRDLAVQACGTALCSVAALASPRSTPRRWPARRGHVPTALSSTDLGTTVPDVPGAWRRRGGPSPTSGSCSSSASRPYAGATWPASLSLVFLVVTVAVAIVPAFVPGAAGPVKAFDIPLLIPSAMAGLLVLNIASASPPAVAAS